VDEPRRRADEDDTETMMTTSGGAMRIFLAAAGLAAVLATGAAAQTDDEWAAYGRDPGGGRFSPLAQITPANVSRLAVAWTYSTGEAREEMRTRASTSFEATPLVVDGTMYLSTPLGRVIALDPATGAERWVFDPKVDRSVTYGDFTSRGVSTWVDPRAGETDACRRRIVVATIDARLISLDARDGTPCAGFGEGGTVDLRRGLRTGPHEAAEYEMTSPPAVVNGMLVVGSAIADNSRTDAASGEVRGFDARTGAPRWTFHTVPQDPADPAYASWRGPEAHRTGGANAWSVIAADPARDLVFVPTGAASPDYFGGARLGDNRYANSLVALRAATGAVVWHFQTVHHDLWDYDNASPPALVTLRRDGRDVPAVVQATKTGMLFVLHRETGEPIFPVHERPVPASDVPGEEASPTQPFSSIDALVPHALHPDSVSGPTPEATAYCRAKVAGLRNEGIFTPPSLQGSLVVPGNVGGAHWGGVAYDPVHRLAIVPVNHLPAVVQLLPRDTFAAWRARWRAEPSRGVGARDTGDWQYTDMRGTPYVMRRTFLFTPGGHLCSSPSGRLVAVSLETGRRVWDVPLGDLRAMTGLPEGPATGSPNLGGAIATAGGVVFIAATLDRAFRAFDAATGRELWRADLPAGGKATPMTYGAGGRQYVVIAAGGDGGRFGKDDELIAYALPDGAR
jgi:quinoprotein glucose dehydrogenase